MLAEKPIFVVAADRARADLSHERERAARLGTSNDHVADEEDTILASPTDIGEKVLELVATSVDVADDDRAAHLTCSVALREPLEKMIMR